MHFFVSLTGFLLGSMFLLLSLRIGPMFPLGGNTGLCIGYTLCGIIGGGILGSGMGKITSVVRGAVGFGVGFLVLSFVIPMMLMMVLNTRHMQDDIFYLIFILGISFFIAGAIGPSMIKIPGLGGLKRAVLGGSIFGIVGVLISFLSLFFHSKYLVVIGLMYFSAPLLSGGILGGVLKWVWLHSVQEKTPSLNVRKVLQYAAFGVMMVAIGVGFYLLPEYQEKRKINQLLSSGVDINNPPGTTIWYGREIAENAPLHNEVIMGRIKSVRELIKAGADVNLERTDGFTALHLAVMNNREGIAKLLIIEGADVNAKTNDGKTPLHLAQKNPRLTDILISAGADVNDFEE